MQVALVPTLWMTSKFGIHVPNTTGFKLQHYNDSAHVPNTTGFKLQHYNDSARVPTLWMTSKFGIHVPNTTGFKLHHYNDSALRQSMKLLSLQLQSHGVVGAFDAFEKVIPWAYKADLWRYAILWKYGGVYLDHECVPNEQLSEIVNRFQKDGTFHVCDDSGAAGGIKKKLWQGFLISDAGNPILLTALKISIKNIKEEVYNHPLDITGPGVMRTAMPLTYIAKCAKVGLGDGSLVWKDNSHSFIQLDPRQKRSKYAHHFGLRQVYNHLAH
jgi:hypothetical protein